MDPILERHTMTYSNLTLTSRIGRLATMVAIVVGTGVVGTASADTEADIAKIWADPAFQKAFVGSYGVNAEIEPRVTPAEVKLLEKIRPLMEKNDLAAAEELIKKGMKPDSSAIFDFTLGNMQFQQSRMAEALANYEAATRKFPSFRRAWRNMGLINARDGKFDEAIRSFTKMIELGGGDAYSYGLLGFAYASKQDFQAAEAAYRNALLLQPDNDEWRLGLTRCVFRQAKFQDAAALLDGLIERYPDKPDFWLLQAQTYLGMKQPLRAAENLEAIDLLGKATLDSLYTLGDIYLTENLNDLAVRAYAKAIALNAEQPVGRSLKVVEQLAARGAINEAKTVATAVRSAFEARLDETEKRSLLKLEARIAMAEGTGSADAVVVLEQIVELDPLDGEALMLLGQHYARESQPDRSVLYYERAARIESFEANAKLRMAKVLVDNGRYKDAIPALKRAQEIKPRDDVARLLDQVERIARTRS
jgi:tetratricopeptide (TPR) repeat protein